MCYSVVRQGAWHGADISFVLCSYTLSSWYMLFSERIFMTANGQVNAQMLMIRSLVAGLHEMPLHGAD